MTNFLKSIDGNDILITTGLAALGAELRSAWQFGKEPNCR